MKPAGVGQFRDILFAAIAGIRDAVSVHNSLIFFVTSHHVRLRTFQCFVLNGILFLGSLWAVSHVFAPLMRLILSNNEDPSLDSAGESVTYTFTWLYQILWIFPMYAISFILSTVWYQDIAEHAYLIRGGQRKKTNLTFQRWLNAMSEEVFRLLLSATFLLQIAVLSFVPFVGNFLCTLHLCWLYALYSFEYKWMFDGWRLEQRLLYLERRWAYFAGFGFPAAMLTVFFPTFVSSGIFSFLFPMFIILAIIGKPVAHRKAPSAEDDKPTGNPGRIPIFYFPKRLNHYLLGCIRARAQL